MRNYLFGLALLVPCFTLVACGSSNEESASNSDAGFDVSSSKDSSLDATLDSTGSETGTADLCGNGLDDNANGKIDEECDCTLGSTQSCFPGLAQLAGKGICKLGSQFCEASTSGEFKSSIWGACLGSGTPVKELCNGLDDDCDGTVDNDCPCVDKEEKTCSSLCGSGKQVCAAAVWGTCSAKQPQAETCNGLDDDCDGAIDNAAPCQSGHSCLSGTCVEKCSPVNGAWTDWSCSTCDHCISPTKSCTRSCTNPAPLCGGADCVGAASSQEDCSENSPLSLSFSSGTQSFGGCHEIRSGVVPVGVAKLDFSIWGGGGGGGAPGNGGGGAYAKASLPVSAGDKIELRIACGGAGENGGGGASYVYRNGAIAIVVAGGGGGGSDGSGGGSTSWNPAAGRGGGGGAIGGVGEAGMENNNYSCGSGAGQGGSQTAGGAGGISTNNCTQWTQCAINGVAGSADSGGMNAMTECKAGSSANNAWGGCPGCGNGCGGGGGSGYFGGGSGGGKYTYTGGGGGGGSSWAAGQVIVLSTEAGAANTAGGSAAPGYNGTAGRGGVGEQGSLKSTAGSPGQVSLTIP